MTKEKLSLLLSILLGLLASIFAGSCSKMEDSYKAFIEGGEIRYSQKPDTLGVYPGHNRVEAWLVANRANISKFKVYWNNRLDSIEVPVTAAFETDTLRVTIDNMLEGSYTFEFFTFDREGNTSVGVDTIGEVFGDLYTASLTNRLIRTSGLVNNNIKIEWLEVSNEQVMGTEIWYQDQSGAEHVAFVEPEEGITRIPGRPLNDVIRYRTLFRPHTQSIDVFYTTYRTVTLDIAQPIALDKSKFIEYKLPSDAPLSRYADAMADLWDGTATSQTFYGTETGSGSPHWFTFDMGVTAVLSRIQHFQRALDNHSLLYNNANVRVFEVWGSNDPNPDGSWDDSWVKLLDGVSQKPSGLPRGQLNEDDLAQVENGEDFVFPEDLPAVRYIRVKVLDTWNPAANDRSFIAEWTLYGVAE